MNRQFQLLLIQLIVALPFATVPCFCQEPPATGDGGNSSAPGDDDATPSPDGASDAADDPAADPAAPAADPPETPTEPADPPAETPADLPADPADAPEDAKPAGPVGDPVATAKAWADKLAEWKEILKELRALRVEFSKASDDEAVAIQAKWDAAIAKGEAMIPELQRTALAAFAAAPNEDRQLERFLVKMLQDQVTHDRYESAVELAQSLIDSGCVARDLKSLAGVAAFALDDFETAERHLAAAEAEGTLTPQAANLNQDVASAKEDWKVELAIRAAEAAADDLPRVKLETTKGEIVIELFENEAPGAVGNFVSLVESGYYNGLTFHRVLGGFMAQGGDPLGDGTGDPGYKIYCECYEKDARKHFRGTLSMANAGRDTAGSQFFLTFRATPHLNGRHTVFGRVISGWEVLQKLQRRNPEDEPPLPDPDKIVSAEVLRKRDHEYVPNKVK